MHQNVIFSFVFYVVEFSFSSVGSRGFTSPSLFIFSFCSSLLPGAERLRLRAIANLEAAGIIVPETPTPSKDRVSAGRRSSIEALKSMKRHIRWASMTHLEEFGPTAYYSASDDSDSEDYGSSSDDSSDVIINYSDSDVDSETGSMIINDPAETAELRARYGIVDPEEVEEMEKVIEQRLVAAHNRRRSIEMVSVSFLSIFHLVHCSEFM